MTNDWQVINPLGCDVTVLGHPCFDLVVLKLHGQRNVINARRAITIRGDKGVDSLAIAMLRESRRDKKPLLQEPMMKGSTGGILPAGIMLANSWSGLFTEMSICISNEDHGPSS